MWIVILLIQVQNMAAVYGNVGPFHKNTEKFADYFYFCFLIN